jgi:L-serine deaminase
MGYPTDTRLKSMARSLQQQIGMANELQLGFTAQLLAMAVMEITTKMHGISQQELHALCECIEQGSSFDRKQAVALNFGLRGCDRRSRARRGRV